MGVLDQIMKGYSDRVLGPDTGAAAQQTASSYQRLQDAINQDYSQQQKMFETNPDNKGKQWVPPSPSERLQDQVGAMIQSGDPALQQRGLQLFGTIQPKGKSPTAGIQEYQFAKSQGYDGSFADWKNSLKQGTNITLNTGAQRGQYLTEQEKAQGGLDPNAPYVWTQDGPKPVQVSKVSEAQKPLNVAETTVNDLDTMLFGDQGLLKDYGTGTGGRVKEVIKANVERFSQNDPRYAIYDQTVQSSLSSLARSIGGEKGALAEGDIQRVQTLLPVLTGINPDTPQVARQKIRRLKNLVKLARSKGGLDSKEIKRYTTGYGSQIKKREESSSIGVPASIAKPVSSFTSSGGIKFTVE